MKGNGVDLNSPAYQLERSELVKHYATNSERGLSQSEVVKRLEKYGPNELEHVSERKIIFIFLDQFYDLLVLLLAVAAGLAFLFGEWVEGLAIIAVILLNALIGAFMEIQAKRSMDALKKLSQKTARVIRDGAVRNIPSRSVVPGDIIYVEAGDIISADARLLKMHNLAVNESALTGESMQVSKSVDLIRKKVPLGDRRNMIFNGTMVTRGNAHAVVTDTGQKTELGKIAALTQSAEKESTPLEKKLNVLSRKMIWLTLVLGACILVIGLLQGRPTFLMIETTIALAIAAIPEGLPVVATIALARGMLRLARHNVIVKKLSAVETLGETDVLCTDKTGTLTENQMLPERICLFEHELTVQHTRDGMSLDSSGNMQRVLDLLAKVAVLCNNAELDDNEGIGDPLEVALLKLFLPFHDSLPVLRSKYERIREIPFDSQTKWMATLHNDSVDDQLLVTAKGALEVIVPRCKWVLSEQGVQPLDDPQDWLSIGEDLASRGLRLLAFCYQHTKEDREDFFGMDAVFLGFVAFLDPPRSDVPEAIRQFQKAGIEVVMLTGDHLATAKNIAEKTSLITDPQAQGMQGDVLEDLEKGPFSPSDLMQVKVFARVSPTQKLKLIEFYQKEGKTVAMTGDGANDTPALKKSDIGIAMGKRGTEAAKEVADLVLEDDRLRSIVTAIKQGRGIFENIRYFVIYLLSCNLSELLVVSIAFFTNMTTPLLPLQILFINMVTDVFPALALGMNREGEKVMENPPRPRNEPIITRGMWTSIVVYAIVISISTLGALYFATYYLQLGRQLTNNFAFYALILAQLWHVFNLVNIDESFLFNAITKNGYIWLAIIICILIVVVAYSIPVSMTVLNLAPFPVEYLLYILAFSLLPIVVIRFLKRLNIVN